MWIIYLLFLNCFLKRTPKVSHCELREQRLDFWYSGDAPCTAKEKLPCLLGYPISPLLVFSPQLVTLSGQWFVTWPLVSCQIGLVQEEGTVKRGAGGLQGKGGKYMYALTMVIAKGILVQELLAQEIAFCRSLPSSQFAMQI